MHEVTAIVAEFQKDARGRLELWSLVVFEEERDSYTSRKHYDVEWSKKFDSHLFDYCGAGGGDVVEVSGIYFAQGRVTITETPTTLVHGRDHPPWMSPETQAIRARNRTRRLKGLPRRYRHGHGGNLLGWLRDNGIEGPSVWCSECRDTFPDNQACEHIWWCDASARYSTPSERCGCATRAVCSGDFSCNEERFAFSPEHPPLRECRSW